jgi:hypothetical protein
MVIVSPRWVCQVAPAVTGGALSAAVGLAFDDEFVAGGYEPVDADWASSGSVMTAIHSDGSRLLVTMVLVWPRAT